MNSIEELTEKFSKLSLNDEKKWPIEDTTDARLTVRVEVEAEPSLRDALRVLVECLLPVRCLGREENGAARGTK